ncbi:hypothetical protein AX16_008848 [Volvariella volvacea WC 439]|nr:hypothetical protein AX16_008848 [Volvariella volvacea WC 439]
MSDDELVSEVPDLIAPAPKARQPRSNGHDNRVKAGPSSKAAAEGGQKTRPPGRPAKRSRVSPSPQPRADVERINVDTEDEEVEEGAEVRDDDDEIVQISPPAPTPVPPPPQTNGQGRKPVTKKQVVPTAPAPAKQVNGTVKGKGRAKSGGTGAVARKVRSEEVADAVDDDEVESVQGPGPNVAKAINAASGSRARGRPNVSGEVERLRKKNEELYAHVQALQLQLEEVLYAQTTEAEEISEGRIKQLEAQLEEQDRLIQQLTGVAESKEPLLRTGRTSVLHLIPQQAADEQSRELEREFKRWKDIAEERQTALSNQNQRIEELVLREKDLQAELNAEMERARVLAAKVPKNSQRGFVDDPKQTQLIKFYEDLTNLLVTGLKYQKLTQDPNEKECWVFHCVYSYPPEEAAGDYIKDLNFTLRLEPEIPGSEGPPVIHYSPLQLDKENPQLVQKLGFLSGPFTFPRHQLALFLRTLHDNVKGTDEETTEGGEDDDDEVEEVSMVEN